MQRIGTRFLPKWVATVVCLLLIGAVAAGCGREKLPVIKAAPDFTLDSAYGGTASLDQFSGKVRLVEFLYTNCPDICPATTYNMVQIQKALKDKQLFGDKVQFFSISFDPEHDTAEVLKQYADKLGIDNSGWSVLRGSEDATAGVLKDYGVMAIKQDDGTFIHNINTLFLIDQKGNIRKVYTMGDQMDTADLQKQIIALAKG